MAGQRNAIDGRLVGIVAEWTAMSSAVPRVRGRWRRWWPGSSARHRPTRTPSLRSRTASRSSPAVWRVCGRAGCHWIRSGLSRGGRPRGPMSTTRSWLPAPRSASCAPRSSSNRDPNPNHGPNPILDPSPIRDPSPIPIRIVGRSRSGPSARPPTRNPPAGGSRFRTSRRRSSMPRWPLIGMRWSPTGSATTRRATPRAAGCAIRRRRFPTPSMRS